jgi:hypothetical protein
VSAATPNKPAPVVDRVNALVRKAQAGDKEAMSQLRKLMDHPVTKKMFFDLARRVRESLIEKFARDDCVLRELIEREVGQLRAELLGPDPTAAERLLAERVAIGWLEVHTAERQLGNRSLDDAAFWQRQVDHAHRRFLAALRTLATLRRLPRPAVQVNIAEQQVNVSG